MTIIAVRPSQKFIDAWVAFEAPGVEAAFSAKSDAIDYACQRFGCGRAGRPVLFFGGAHADRRLVQLRDA